MKKHTSIVIIGSLSWDTIMDFPHAFKDYFHPEKLHQINVSFVVNNLDKQMGGTAANIAYGMSQIRKILYKSNVKGQMSNMHVTSQRIPDIKILGGLGKDGKEYLDFFRKNNIDTSGIVVDRRIYGGHGSVITDVKDNQIWGFYYGANETKKIDFKKHIKKDHLVVLSATHPSVFLSAQKYLIKNKIDYIYDVGMCLTWINDTDLKQGVLHAKYVIGNDYEVGMILKRVKLSIHELTGKGISVITTLGKNGCQLKSVEIGLNRLKSVSAIKVKKVIDPTGAGDAWRGGFMMAIVFGYDMIECLKIGNVVASFAVEKFGTVNYKISKKEFNRRLNNLK